MGQIMAMYPEHIIAAVCNPTYGICTRIKYLPSLMELKEELEKLAQRDAERDKILKRRKDQLEGRFNEDSRMEEIARTRADGTRPTYEQLIEKLPDNLRIPSMRSNRGMMTEADKAKAMAQLASVGITKEVFDTIPNQGDYNWKKPALNIPKSTHKPHNDDPRAEVKIDGSLKILDEKESNPFEN